MAFFDPKTGKLVLQIVYDGAAFAGKTASVESLGRMLDRPVVSPETEAGRTLLFDWMEYEGGARYGRPIVCRVLTVPGQADLANRRVGLIRSADAILFIADSRSEEVDRTVEHWSSLQMLLARWDLKPPINLQVNHCDSPSALPPDEVIRRLGPQLHGRAFETVAVGDQGTREAFVLTVSDCIRDCVSRESMPRDFEKEPDTQPIRPFDPDELAGLLSENQDLVTANVPQDTKTEAPESGKDDREAR